jgi:hypothetical protein
MLPVGRHRRPFQPGGLAAFEPELGGPGDGGALAVGGMRAGADGDPDDRMMSIGVTLLGKGLDMAVAALINVVDDPRLLHLPARAFPGSLADGHAAASYSLTNTNAHQ